MKETSESGITADDTHTKKDIMSILVRARQADLHKDRTAYAMSDTAMIDQVVSGLSCCQTQTENPSQLTFLGAGHETTASGLTWVCIDSLHISGKTLLILIPDPLAFSE